MQYNNPLLKDIVITPLMGFDTEFNNLDTKHADLACFSLANERGELYVCEFSHYKPQDLQKFFRRLDEETIFIICHNSKVEIGIVYSNLSVLLRKCWCTMLASQIIDNGYGYQVGKEAVFAAGHQLPEDYEAGNKLYYTGSMVGNIPYLQSPHGLIGTIKRYLGISANTHKEKKRLQKSFIDFTPGQKLTKEQLDYAASDVEHLIPLYNAQYTWMLERKLQKIVQLENTLTPVLVKMEFRGCRINIDLHKENIVKWEAKLVEITNQLDTILKQLSLVQYPQLQIYSFDRNIKTVEQFDLFGGGKIIRTSQPPFNYTSPHQLKEMVELCGIDAPKDGDGKISFGEETLMFYNTNNPNNPFYKFFELLLSYREYEKLIGTYGEKLLNHLDGERIRTSYSQCWTDTGRLASSEIKKGLGLNLANIPKNADIRKIFIPDEDFVFIDSDMVGQELVLAGDFAQEPVLLKAFQEGFDHHSFLATISYSIIFGQKVEIKNVNEEFTIGEHTYNYKKIRDVHKSALFSKVYLGGPARIQGVLNQYLVNHVVPEERFNTAKKISQELDKALKTLIKWLKSKVEETKKNGYLISNKLGRRRYFEHPERAYGDCANFPIQGSGGDAMKIAMIKLDKFFEETAAALNIPEEQFGYLCLSVYDQCLCNVNKAYLEEAKTAVPKIMGEALTYFLTILTGSSDVNVRTYWGK